MTKVSAVTCPECKYTIFSRALHDFRQCECGKISIDGGFDYVKIGFPPTDPVPKIFTLEIEQTPMELYNDWNNQTEKFGKIAPE